MVLSNKRVETLGVFKALLLDYAIVVLEDNLVNLF